MNKKDLKKLGFTDNMANVYLHIIESISPVRAVELLRETELGKSSLYEAIASLEKRMLITKIEEGHGAKYIPNDPNILVQEAESYFTHAKTIADKIKSDFGISQKRIRLYQGYDAIQQISDKSLESGEEVLFLGPSKFGEQAKLGRYWERYHKQRIKKKIQCRIMYDRSTISEILKERNTLKQCEARYMPYGFETPIWFMVSGSLTSVIIPTEDPPIVITLSSEVTASRLRKHFNDLWNETKKIK